MIKKILIANRGEIAIRVIRACQELGIRNVTIYSDADKDSLHVQYAEEAVRVGPPQPIESYLAIGKIIKIAKDTGCNAIHPGYGFLAENAEFAKACEENNLIFIGPTSQALALVGDKIAARKTIVRAGVPIIPGSRGIKTKKTLRKEAKRIGLPILLKAALGGGGKGMRVIEDSDALIASFEAGKREAGSAFGNDTIYIEKYLKRPRHIEFQILADNHGNIIHLNERECSIQRRHQKIIEETPSTALNPELRAEMGKAAKKVIKASGYTNAGTVEFLLDQDNNFYFLEVNARIQVEHPVTELVTGVDLVKQQVLIAGGARIPYKQSDIQSNGHAIECRIYAENPDENFLPSPGKILLLREPKIPGLRIDSGIFRGFEITPYYDPILSKAIAWGSNREEARIRMISALKNYIILGIPTIIPFLISVLQTEEFIKGNLHTGLVGEMLQKLKKTTRDDIALMTYALSRNYKNKVSPTTVAEDKFDPWKDLGSWQLGGVEWS